MKKRLAIFSILTIIFSLIIFLTKTYFFDVSIIENELIEENFIEPTIVIPKEKKETKKTELNSAEKLYFFYFPYNFKKEKEAQEFKAVLKQFFNSKYIFNKLIFLKINLYKEEWEVRWKMKNKSLHLFSLYRLDPKEVLSVWIHEFWHFLDLYILQKNIFGDLSDDFYNISWKSTKILKTSQSQKDFVSGYSMTNKYEDFAETFTYFILHNSDFAEKSKKSVILKQKYDFFVKNIFKKWEFQTSSYKNTTFIKDYYWDITKINYNLEKFLKYLGK